MPDKRSSTALGPFPWTRYEADTATNSRDTKLHKSGIYAEEATGFKTVELLGANSFLEWKIKEDGEGVVLRFSAPDNKSGTGREFTLHCCINGGKPVPIKISSRYAHHYGSEFDESNNPALGNQRRVFDEIRFKLPVKNGDTLRLLLPVETGAKQPLCIDFIEVEPVPPPAPPMLAAALDVTLFGVIPNDGKDDSDALIKCLNEGAPERMIYIPSGIYHLNKQINLPPDVIIQGAGMWHTELHFTNKDDPKKSGFVSHPQTKSIIMRDLMFYGEGTLRGSVGSAFIGPFGENSLLENLWWEHMNNTRFIENRALQIRKCRVRNVMAGGIILMNGSVNAVVDSCHVRHANDDGIATFAACKNKKIHAVNSNITFQNNLIELTARAGGIGVFGGNSTKIYSNQIIDTLPSAQADLRFTSSFDSHPFGSKPEDVHEAFNNELIGCRSQMGSIVFATKLTPVNNILIRDTTVSNLHSPFLYMRCQKPQRSENITFKNINISLADEKSYTCPGVVAEKSFNGCVNFINVLGPGKAWKVDNRSDAFKINMGFNAP